MRLLRPLSLLLACLLACHPGARAQTPGSLSAPPASGTLTLPAKKNEPAHAPPKAAPVEPVHRVGEHGHAAPSAKPPAVIAPKSSPAKHPPHGKAPAAPATPTPPVAAPPVTETKPAPPAEAPKGASGLPLPRFAALRSDDVNMRSGPGTRYPIEWVYKRRDLPVEIEREFEVWRLVRDQEGVKGWVHQATLTGRRTFVVIGGERDVYRAADDTAAVVAVLKPGVIGRIKACQAAAAWCEVQVGEYRGWLKRDGFWGTYPAEAVTP